MFGWFVFLAGFAPVTDSQAADSIWGWRGGGAYSTPNQDALFYLGPSRVGTLAEAYVTYARGGLYFHGTAFRETRDGFETEARGVVNELYLDTQLADWDVTVGKKRLGWGVGFGFRPLDVIKPEPRRALIPPTPEGLPMLVFERYTATRAYTFLCGNDFSTADGRFESGGNECALRYFGTGDGLDVSMLLHTSKTVRAEVGADFSWVPNDRLEVHGALLAQRRYYKWINVLTEQDIDPPLLAEPMEYRAFDDGIQALLGFGYTWPSGHSLLFEVWHDDAGYSAGEWRALRRLTGTQRALFGDPVLGAAAVGNVAASTAVLGQPNLMQRNLLLRWSWDGEKLDPAFDVLLTPDDGGTVATLSATHTLGAYTLNYGLRRYGGASDSMMRALPADNVAFLTVKSAFNW